jgi:hypothetical protein
LAENCTECLKEADGCISNGRTGSTQGLRTLGCLFNVSSTSAVLTSPLTPLLRGEGSKTLVFSFLLPCLLGEGGREGEVHRTHVYLAARSQDVAAAEDALGDAFLFALKTWTERCLMQYLLRESVPCSVLLKPQW